MTEAKNFLHIDRANEKAVDKHIRSVFIDLKKYKTKILLNSYYQWYVQNPQYQVDRICEFDFLVRENKNSFSAEDKMVKPVYGDKHATILTKFVRQHRIFANELFKIARNTVELCKVEGRGKLGFSKLFNDEELKKIEEVFKLLQVGTGSSLVTQTNCERREESKKFSRKAPNKPVENPYIKRVSENTNKSKTPSKANTTTAVIKHSASRETVHKKIASKSSELVTKTTCIDKGSVKINCSPNSNVTVDEMMEMISQIKISVEKFSDIN